MGANIKLGFAPTRRAIFSAPAAIEYRGLTAKRLRELNIDFVDIDDVNEEGLLYDDAGLEKIVEKFKREKVDGLFLPHTNFGTEYECARLAKTLGVPVLLWGPREANPGDSCYLVPAFSGLGAPYWDSSARAAIVGMSRTTGKNEVVRAALECIAYQITDIVRAMGGSAGTPIGELRVDGGPTRNAYLMQFQSDLLGIPVRIPDSEELSGIGAAYAAGLASGVYNKGVYEVLKRKSYAPSMAAEVRDEKYGGWQDAVRRARGQ